MTGEMGWRITSGSFVMDACSMDFSLIGLRLWSIWETEEEELII